MEFQSGAVRPVGSIEDGWNIIKDDYWTFFGMTLVTIIILVVAAVILGAINNAITFGISTVLGIASSSSGDAAKISAAVLPQLISMVISIFTNIIVGAVSGAFCLVKRVRYSGPPAFGPVPERPSPPKGWLPTTAPIWLRLT